MKRILALLALLAITFALSAASLVGRGGAGGGGGVYRPQSGTFLSVTGDTTLVAPNREGVVVRVRGKAFTLSLTPSSARPDVGGTWYDASGATLEDRSFDALRAEGEGYAVLVSVPEGDGYAWLVERMVGFEIVNPIVGE